MPYPGYRGIAIINNKNIRCLDFNVNATQEVSFYKHVMGLNDTLIGATNASSKGETVGTIGNQNIFWRPSPISIEGSMSFPACGDDSTVNFSDLFGYAKYGNYFNITFKHYCGEGEKYSACRISNFTFSVAAGDTVKISASVLAADMEYSDVIAPLVTTAEKIMTWDTVNITITDPDAGGITTTSFNNFQFTINNNANNVYTAKPYSKESYSSYKSLLPRDIRLGTQEVTGSLSMYSKQGREFITALIGKDGPATIELKCGPSATPIFTTKINAIFLPIQLAGAPTVSIIEVPFIGVGKAFGD